MGLLLAIGGLVLAFSLHLYQLARFALGSELYSYVLLIPFVSIYMFRVNQDRAAPFQSAPNRAIAMILAVAGVAVLAAYWTARMSQAPMAEQDALTWPTLALVLILAAACAFFLRGSALRAAVFPLFFLLFMVPFPIAMEHAIESFLQYGSAPPAFWFFQLVGTPVFQQDLVFQLPGMTLQIAPECSGIRSTLVLFMTSLIAGQLFLHSPWKRVLLTVVVIPLALVRNGFRVFVIGELCVRVGPHMIDSPIHHQGGPIFFALSLIPFSILVFFLVKSDRRASSAKQQSIAS